MNTNKQTRRSHDDDPLPAGTIIHLRGLFPELEAVSPGKMSPEELAAELGTDQEAEVRESTPRAPDAADREAASRRA